MDADGQLRARIAREPSWFHRMTLAPGIVTPGWSDPSTDKLPYFGLPDDLTGKRVLDVGCCEGFFSFECERRGAREVVAIDSQPDVVQRFWLCREALGSQVNGYLCNVYDLTPRAFGTFDLVLFFGVLYHLRHPLLALERIRAVCAGTLLMQSAVAPEIAADATPLARFYPAGMASGPQGETHDPTIFWMPNAPCVAALVAAAGFVGVENVSTEPHIGVALRATSPTRTASIAPSLADAPWS